MACIVVPWFADRYAAGTPWQAVAWWIHDHLPYSELQFFPQLAAFNIGWHEAPQRRISSYIAPRGILTSAACPITTAIMPPVTPDFPPLAVPTRRRLA